jgi:hypothetical protein
VKRHRRLRQLTPDPELFRRRATGATFRQLAPGYGVSHTALSRYSARPQARKQLKQAEQLLRAAKRAAAARRQAERRLERDVRRKASQQAALEREKLRRLTGIGCVASSLIANWCADGWPGRRCDGSLATTGCGTRPWAAGSDDPKWPGNSSKPAAGRGLIRPLRPQDARRDSGSQAGEPNGRPSASELALHDRPRLATPAEPAPQLRRPVSLCARGLPTPTLVVFPPKRDMRPGEAWRFVSLYVRSTG